MKLNIGYCGICEKQIWSMTPGKPMEPNEFYREFYFFASNNTIARHAICNDCIATLDAEKVCKVFERIKDTWIDELAGKATEEYFESIRAQKVVSYGLTDDPEEHKVITYVI